MANLKKLAAAVSAAVFLSLSSSATATTNAEEAEPNSYPYIARINVSEHAFCSGAILNATTVITSPLCASAALNQTVTTGDHRIWEEEGYEQEHNIERVIIHPEYKQFEYKSYVALLKLATPIQMNDVTQPIALSNSAPSANATGGIYGWGALSTTTPTSERLMEAPQTVAAFEACEKAYADFGTDLTNKYCVQDSKYIPCTGDDGIPMIISNKLVGLYAYTADISCGGGIPSVYTDISKYKAWIESHL